MNAAIIVAAGSGSRFGGPTPKQFVEILGKPLLHYSLERFEACAAIDSIVVVLPHADLKSSAGHLEGLFPKISAVVAGGDTRQGSVRNGLDALPESADIVAVHDGARPLIPDCDILSVIDAARRSGAACLTAPLTDTIKTVTGEEVSGTLDRERLRRALTPQAFRVEVLRAAFAAADDGATDECMLVERLGHPILAVEGSTRNIKVTTADDLVMVEALLQADKQR